MTTPPLVRVEGSPVDLASMTTAQLRAELAKALEITAAHLTRLAWIVRALEERGENLSDLRIGLLDYLRKIAAGQLLAEVVVRFAETPALMRTVAALPLPDQRHIAAGEPIPLVVRRPDGSFDRLQADPLKMTGSQVRQVFRRGRICDEAEQRLVLESAGPPAPRPTGATVAPPGSVRVDARTGTLRIGNRSVPVAAVVEALAEIRGNWDNSPANVALMVKLTEGEHVALKNAASRGGVSMVHLVRRALFNAGLLAGE